MIELEAMDEDDEIEVKTLIEKHFQYTGSDPAEWILENWDDATKLFVKVMPKDYKAVLKKSGSQKVRKTETLTSRLSDFPTVKIKA